jgi:hypothetical protein
MHGHMNVKKIYHQVWHLEILHSAHTLYLLVPYQLLFSWINFSLSAYNGGLTPYM